MDTAIISASRGDLLITRANYPLEIGMFSASRLGYLCLVNG